jgi:hypothetical protein
VDAIEHLRAMVNRRLRYPGECPDCQNWISFERPNHQPDCPWLAAKAFVEEQDRPPKTSDQIRAEMDKIAIDSAKHGPPRHWGGY